MRGQDWKLKVGSQSSLRTYRAVLLGIAGFALFLEALKASAGSADFIAMVLDNQRELALKFLMGFACGLFLSINWIDRGGIPRTTSGAHEMQHGNASDTKRSRIALPSLNEARASSDR